MRATGGGVFIAVDCSLDIHIIKNPLDSTESVWCCVRLRKIKKIVIGAFYRLPNSNVDVMDAFSSTLKSIAENQKDSMIIVGGDFNLPSINWENLCLVRGGSDRESCEALIDALSSNSLEQLVKRPTRGNNILDIFATNSPERILRISKSLRG